MMRRRLSLLVALLASLPFVNQNRLALAEHDPVLVGAGDIAACTMAGDEATARLIDDIEGTVFTAGDNAYPEGSVDNFKQCYDPSWGRFKRRTRPSLGNHDYATKGAVPYFDYFGANAGPDHRGFYSYDLGAWHIVVLDSNVDARIESIQGKWLADDLKAHPSPCTLAYWHHPLFSSGMDRNRPRDIPAMWQILYQFGVDVVVNGHFHEYERFVPLNPDGEPDPEHGIREFIVGTGGASLGEEPPEQRSVTSAIWNGSTWGVIEFTLHPTSYEWAFIPVKGSTFTDSGSADCVTPGGQVSAQPEECCVLQNAVRPGICSKRACRDLSRLNAHYG